MGQGTFLVSRHVAGSQCKQGHSENRLMQEGCTQTHNWRFPVNRPPPPRSLNELRTYGVPPAHMFDELETRIDNIKD